MKKLLLFALILTGCAKQEIEPANSFTIDGEAIEYNGMGFQKEQLPDGNYDCEFKFYGYYRDQYIKINLITNEPDHYKIRGVFPFTNKIEINNAYLAIGNNGVRKIRAREGQIEFKIVDKCLVISIYGSDEQKEFSYYSKSQELSPEYY